jgi:hypothetical protein
VGKTTSAFWSTLKAIIMILSTDEAFLLEQGFPGVQLWMGEDKSIYRVGKKGFSIY